MMADSPGAPDAPLLRTSLYQVHLGAGARMVPFGGWEMPVQYTSIIAEHLAVREGVGLFDLSHMGRLYFRGAAGRAAVQRITTNDVERLAPGRAQYSLICNLEGGVRDDTVVYNLGESVLVVVNASNRQKILGWLGEQLGPSGRPDDRTAATAMIGVQGPAAQPLLETVTDAPLDGLRYYAALEGTVAGVPALIARTGYTGEDGFELIVEAEAGPELWRRLASLSSPLRPTPCGLGARDTLRLEAGMPLYGHEIDEQTTPYEAGLGRVVRLDKGEFVGRDALSQFAERPPARRLVGFQMVDNAVPRQGYAVLDAAGQSVGVVTSGTHSPSLRRNVGMAYVPPQRDEPDSEIWIAVRERPQRATVVPLPHVPHRTRKLTAPRG